MTTTTHRLHHAACGMPVVVCAAMVWRGGAASRRGLATNPGRIGLKPNLGSANIPFAAQP